MAHRCHSKKVQGVSVQGKTFQWMLGPFLWIVPEPESSEFSHTSSVLEPLPRRRWSAQHTGFPGEGESAVSAPSVYKVKYCSFLGCTLKNTDSIHTSSFHLWHKIQSLNLHPSLDQFLKAFLCLSCLLLHNEGKYDFEFCAIRSYLPVI